jgi:hypothetical protein
MAKTENGEENSVKKPKKSNGVVFTQTTAKEAQKASVAARNARTAMRAQILQAAINEGIDKLFIKALKSNDTDKMAIVEKALKLTGLDFASSEDAVQKMAVDSKNESNVTQTVRFTIAPRPESTTEPKE